MKPPALSGAGRWAGARITGLGMAASSAEKAERAAHTCM
jgi:hypothetical protein